MYSFFLFIRNFSSNHRDIELDLKKHNCAIWPELTKCVLFLTQTSLFLLLFFCRYPSQKEWQRKEQLYLKIIDYFDNDKQWEHAIPLCKGAAF